MFLPSAAVAVAPVPPLLPSTPHYAPGHITLSTNVSVTVTTTLEVDDVAAAVAAMAAGASPYVPRTLRVRLRRG